MDALYEWLSSIGYTHPLHPMLVHMTIGLVLGAFVFGVVSVLFERQQLRHTMGHCIVLAFVVLFPTVLSGIMDWMHFYAGTWVFPIRIKIILAAALGGLLAVGVYGVWRAPRRFPWLLALCGLCALDVAGMGYFGAELVYAGKQTAVPDKVRVGADLYRRLCSACHPGGGNTIEPDHPVTGSDTLTDLETFASWLRNPDPPMPAFAENKITDKQIEELYEYIVHGMGK